MSKQGELLEILSQELGNGPVLKWDFERMQVVETINQIAPRKGGGLSCGEAGAALVAMILNRRHALYAMEQWAEESAGLASIFPHRQPHEYPDDQLGRGLEALWAAGLPSVHSLVSAAMVQGFGLEGRCVPHDTTSFSFYGTYEAEAAEGSRAGKPAVRTPPARAGSHSFSRLSADRCCWLIPCTRTMVAIRIPCPRSVSCIVPANYQLTIIASQDIQHGGKITKKHYV